MKIVQANNGKWLVKKAENDLILGTNFEPIDSNIEESFLSDEYLESEGIDEETATKLKQLASNGMLFEGYILSASSAGTYYQADASLVLIDRSMNVLLHTPDSIVVDLPLKKQVSYDY